MQTRIVEAGDTIFHEGDASGEAYRIILGKVEISVRAPEGTRSIAQLREGEIFGEMGLVDEKPRSATARALERTELGVITTENFSEVVLGNEEELVRYLAALMERLRTTDALLEIALRQQRGAGDESAGMAGGSSLELAMGPHPGGGGAAAYAACRVLLTSAYEPGGWRGDEIAVEIEHFPYRIGCQFLGPTPPYLRNDLLLRDTLPGYISRDHCAIERNADTIFIRDRGSVAGTIVNGSALGTEAGVMRAALNLGENVIVFGGRDSPHRFFINVVPVES